MHRAQAHRKQRVLQSYNHRSHANTKRGKKRVNFRSHPAESAVPGHSGLIAQLGCLSVKRQKRAALSNSSSQRVIHGQPMNVGASMQACRGAFPGTDIWQRWCGKPSTFDSRELAREHVRCCRAPLGARLPRNASRIAICIEVTLCIFTAPSSTRQG